MKSSGCVQIKSSIQFREKVSQIIVCSKTLNNLDFFIHGIIYNYQIIIQSILTTFLFLEDKRRSRLVRFFS